MKKKNIRRILLEAAAIIAAVVILYWFLTKHAGNILSLLKAGKASEIDDYLEAHGKEGKVLLILLQVVETVSIVLPATPVYLAAGVMFGKIGGVLVCYLTNLVLNVLLFLTARKMHIGKEHTLAIEKQSYISELFAKATRMDRVVVLMCLLPVVPNGMIPYLSAQTNVTVTGFTKALAIGSFPAIAVYVCCGDVLVSDSCRIILPVIIVLVLATMIFFLFRKRLVSCGEKWVRAFLGEE